MESNQYHIRNYQKYGRNIHLDFHTSPWIKDIGIEFDSSEFVKCLIDSSVNSVTIFTKCHHGMYYYPTSQGVQHPALNGRDIFGEMVESLKKAGIRVVAYTTVAWEENLANKFPQWRQMKEDYTFANLETSADNKTKQPAGWKFLNFLHPDYQDYFEQHLNEILGVYEVDGFWIDILFFHPRAGWSEVGRKYRKRWDLQENSVENQRRFEASAQEQFSQRFTKQINQFSSNLTVYYNAENHLFIEGDEGTSRKSHYQDHHEIESLPSGFWGYFHFSRVARHLSNKGKPWNSMTGKFQKMWGDFGGLKPQAALEYECFRTQAMGGSNSVGDQLHPRGRLDKDAYKIIGNVYNQVAEAEDFYFGSVDIKQIGVLSPNSITLDENGSQLSEEGICLLLEELHYEYSILNDDDDLNQFPLLILPDSVVFSDKLRKKFNEYKGNIICSYKSGFNRKNEWCIDNYPLHFDEEMEKYPSYWMVAEDDQDIYSSRVIYSQGLNVLKSEGYETLINRVLPYFKRTDLTYCSHFHAPPDQVDDRHPAAISKKGFIYFADPVFSEYRNIGSAFIRKVVAGCINNMIGEAMLGNGLSTQTKAYHRKKNEDLIITLLKYIPVRKAMEIDVIEEGLSMIGEEIKLIDNQHRLFCYSEQRYLDKLNDKFYLPDIKGRCLLIVPNFFSIAKRTFSKEFNYETV